MIESDQTGDISIIESACKQLGNIIRGYIKSSMGDSGYGRAVEAISVMREEALEHEEPGLFNEFMVGLKKELLSGGLGGDRGEMWFSLRRSKLGLIQRRETSNSEVDEDAAKAFLSAK